jgi:glycosyltransferase involved in cell wall biosynthesis
MRRIRVVQVAGNSEGGGTQIAVQAMAHLDRGRFEVTLVAPDSSRLAAACADAGARFHPLPLMHSRIGRDVRRQLRAFFAEGQPDVVHAHGTRAAWFATRALPASRRAPPFIYSEHLFACDAREGLAQLPWRMIERSLCRRATCVTTSCKRNARRALAYRWVRPEHLRLEHYGIDVAAVRAQAAQATTRDALGLPPGACVVGTVGRLIPQKGVGYLLSAVPEILRARPDTHLIVVGDGELRGALEAHCRALAVADRVHFLGASERPWRLLASCDVIALPSLFEGLPLTALEALAVGRPVVATDVGGVAEVVVPHRTGQLVPSRDPAALAQAIIWMLEHQDERHAMSNAAGEVVASYDQDETIAAFARIYEELGREAPLV